MTPFVTATKDAEGNILQDAGVVNISSTVKAGRDYMLGAGAQNRQNSVMKNYPKMISMVFQSISLD